LALALLTYMLASLVEVFLVFPAIGAVTSLTSYSEAHPVSAPISLALTALLIVPLYFLLCACVFSSSLEPVRRAWKGILGKTDERNQ
jgi:hypothetical protein